MLAGNAYYVPPSFESIQTITVGSGGSSSISFTSIPSTYKHLQIRAIMRDSGSSDSNCTLRFNSDSGSNYSYHGLNGDGSSVYANNGTSQTGIQLNYYYYGSYYGVGITDILDYADTNKYKSLRTLSGWNRNAAGWINLRSANWRSTSAISTITITPDANAFGQYTQFALYGIKG